MSTHCQQICEYILSQEMDRFSKFVEFDRSISGLVAKLCLTFATPWTIAHQAPLSMRFSRQEDWSGLPFPSPGDLPNPGIKPRSPTLQMDSLLPEPPGKLEGQSCMLLYAEYIM